MMRLTKSPTTIEGTVDTEHEQQLRFKGYPRGHLQSDAKMIKIVGYKARAVCKEQRHWFGHTPLPPLHIHGGGNPGQEG